MNIKSIVPQVTALDSRVKTEAPKEVSLQETGDRDPSGKQEQGDGQPHRPLTEEEIKKALEILKSLPGMQASTLTLKIVTKEDCTLVLVLGPKGEVVRRMTELELWGVLQNQSKKTGHILDKAM